MLPEGTITTFGLNLPKRVDNHTRIAIADKLLLMGEARGWGEADLVADIITNYPDDWKHRLNNLAEYLGCHPGTLYNSWNTGKTFPTKATRAALNEMGIKFNACRLLSASWISQQQREGLLDMLANGMTIRELEEELRRLRGVPMFPPPSRDATPIRERVVGWLDTLDDFDRAYAKHYVSLFLDWLEG
jgi:hypothetical protein